MELENFENDVLLWDRFRNGDAEAFVSIFKIYYSALFNYGCKISRQHALIEDCIQDLFLELWRNNGKTEISSLKAYIFTAFKFKLIKLRAKNESKNNFQNHENDFEISKEMLIIHEQETGELTQKVFDALKQLSARQKEVIYLKFYLGFTYEEVSRIMQINYQAARNLVYKSIKELKKSLGPVALFSILFFILLL
ncbi:MAG: RNA polymerase sigma factor [Ginsengibacter sp.]